MNYPLKLLLYPFSLLYHLITAFRNRLYDKGILKSISFDLPIISVGNLRVGGTGKTPMVEYLIDLLQEDYNIATLSRGYGRKTRGFRIAADSDDPFTVGDEPYQIFSKYDPDVVVSVGEDRVMAVPQLLYQNPAIEVILLDDAYQHRRLKPCFQVLLTEYGRLFFDDCLLPAGRLRESRSGASRCDAVVVTKCPDDLSEKKMKDIAQDIRKYTSKPIFYASLNYSTPLHLSGQGVTHIKQVVLVTGIANPQPLVEKIKKDFQLIDHIKYGDHHTYSRKDIRRILEVMKNKPDAVVMTTEKDSVKLQPLMRDLDVSVYTFPIKLSFIKNGLQFDQLVRNAANFRGKNE